MKELNNVLMETFGNLFIGGHEDPVEDQQAVLWGPYEVSNFFILA